MKHNLILKLFFLTFFTLFHISSASAQDLQYPDIVDGGDIPVAVDTTGKFISVQKTVPISIKNISNEPIYFLGYSNINITPYQYQGNAVNSIFFGGYSYYYLINVEEEITTQVTFRAEFLDTISLKGNKLKLKGIIYYRKFSSFDYDSISIFCQFRAVESKKVFIITDKLAVSRKEKSTLGENTIPKRSLITRLFNNSELTFIIDSTKTEVIGQNIIKPFFLKGNNKIAQLPVTILPNDMIYFCDSIKYIIPENTIIPFTIYGHYENSSQIEVLSDTALVISTMWESLRILPYSYELHKINALTGQDVSLSFIKHYNYTDTIWNLVNFTFNADQPENVSFSKYPPLPKKIYPYKNNSIVVYNAEGTYKTTDTGRFRILAEVDYEDDYGNKTKHTVLYIINVTKNTTDVVDEPTNKIEINIMPNPASNLITVGFDEMTEIRNVTIFDLKGNEMLKSGSLVQNGSVDVSALASGVYLIKFDTNSGIITKSIIIKK